jgi:hypothetical protein
MDHMKNITLKTNDVTNIVHLYYFSAYNAHVTTTKNYKV